MNCQKNSLQSKHEIQRQQNIISCLFLLPMMLFFVGFVLIPMGMGIVTSLFNYTMDKFIFIGLKNYFELFQDIKFLVSVKTTVLIVVTSVPLVTVFSLWVASLIYSAKPQI